IGADAAIVDVGSPTPDRALRLAVEGVATARTHQHTLQQVPAALRPLAVTSLVFGQLLLNRREQPLVDDRRYRNRDPIGLAGVIGRGGTAWLDRLSPPHAQAGAQLAHSGLAGHGRSPIGRGLEDSPHPGPVPPGLAPPGPKALRLQPPSGLGDRAAVAPPPGADPLHHPC